MNIRYTRDAWSSSYTSNAHYVDDNIIADRFIAELPIGENECVEFAICYEVAGNTYWDNNGGVNYKLQAKPKASTPKAVKRSSMSPNKLDH